MITFIRRRNLGRGSTRGMVRYLQGLGLEARVLRHWRDTPLPQSEGLVVRWGCTAQMPDVYQGVTVINDAAAIHNVGNKALFRSKMREEYPDITPELEFPAVLRPSRHSRGRYLWVVEDADDLIETVQGEGLGSDHYYGRLIKKAAEYRVYTCQGRVVSVARKTPDDPNAVAWNVAQGGRFDVERFGYWPIAVCEAALKAHKLSGLHFAGVDVMVEEGTDKPYVIEVNSAPSLPLLSDGSVSYRQQKTGDALKWMYENTADKTPFEEVVNADGWCDLSHPCLHGRVPDAN